MNDTSSEHTKLLAASRRAQDVQNYACAPPHEREINDAQKLEPPLYPVTGHAHMAN